MIAQQLQSRIGRLRLKDREAADVAVARRRAIAGDVPAVAERGPEVDDRAPGTLRPRHPGVHAGPHLLGSRVRHLVRGGRRRAIQDYVLVHGAPFGGREALRAGEAPGSTGWLTGAEWQRRSAYADYQGPRERVDRLRSGLAQGRPAERNRARERPRNVPCRGQRSLPCVRPRPSSGAFPARVTLITARGAQRTTPVSGG